MTMKATLTEHALLATGAALGWAGFLLYLGSVPYLDVPGPQFAGNDKLAHLAFYGGLGFAATLAARAWGLPARRAVGIGVAAALVTGGLDELHQRSVPGREGGLQDLAADVAGALIGAVTLAFGEKRVAARARARQETVH